MMDLAKRDIYIVKLRDALEYKRTLLLDKRNELRKNQKDNIFLIDIVSDYEGYYKTIKNERQQQYDALKIISDYVSSIASDTEVTDTLIKESRKQQKMILIELNRLREELNKMTE
jgi:hypothetical protein|tara:strand:- start:1209 stop:1553 length:345 start_codon:yes stop_codon:yes gene_type:complete